MLRKIKQFLSSQPEVTTEPEVDVELTIIDELIKSQSFSPTETESESIELEYMPPDPDEG
jgi:hypothetical protein